jgi:hypothetical protein
LCITHCLGGGLTRVNINKTVVSSSQRLLKLAGVNVLVGSLIGIGSARLGSSGVAIRVTDVVSEPSILATVVGSLVSLPSIRTTSGETNGLEAHILEGDVASHDDQVGP